MIEIFDPIHGPIEICPKAKEIIDTREFQRLRNIKQLGLCYYVFPGASHNRFEHSLGVYHLTKKYIDCLGSSHFTEREILLLSIAGLIHDIGHGPFSHLFDELTKSHHEDRSIELFTHMNTKYSYGYTEEDINFIKDVILPKDQMDPKSKKYLYQIVSNKNGIDVDRFDYIMRDVTMIGLNYGIEWNRIMKGSKIEDGRIIYSEKVRTPINDFFRTRFILYKDIYNHHAVRALEYMIQTIIGEIDSHYKISSCIHEKNWDHFITINDSIIDMYSYTNPTHPLLSRIHTRNLYKLQQEYSYTNEDDKPNLDVNDNVIIDTSMIRYYENELPEYYAGRFKIINMITYPVISKEYHIKVFSK